METSTTDTVWQLINAIPIGTIISWIAVFIVIIGVFCGIAIKAYKIFTKYRNLKDENKKQVEMLNEHDETLKQVNETLNEIMKALEQQQEVNFKQIRYSIVHTCDEAISDGYITAGKLKSVLEMYDEYVNVFHGNGYVKRLVDKVDKLEVRGNLDD